MSLFGGLRSGVTGLFVQTQSMAMISDNIANMNTVGYKANRPRFSTLVTNQGSQRVFSPGGVQSSVGREISIDGQLQSSTTTTDLAIAGDGFFAVTERITRDPATGRYGPAIDSGVVYTRAGEFRPDENGNLKNTAGHYLLGYPPNATGGFFVTNILSQTSAINSFGQASPPTPTSSALLSMNLNEDTAANTLGGQVAMPLIDPSGQEYTMNLGFTKHATAANTWILNGTLNNGAGFLDSTAGALANGGTAGAVSQTNVPLAQIVFNAQGRMNSITPLPTGAGATANTTVTGATANQRVRLNIGIDYNNNFAVPGAAPQDRATIPLDLGTFLGTDGLVEFKGTTSIRTISQNGKSYGTLSSVSVDNNGIVNGLFSNGEITPLAQIPVVTFSNPDGLSSQTGNIYLETRASGTAISHLSGTGGAGTISGSSTEQSTVDISEEFTKLIVTQRAFSANTRTITTADQMLEELMRIKR